MCRQMKSIRQRLEVQKEQVKTVDAAVYRCIQKLSDELLEEEVFLHKFCLALEQILAVYEEGEYRVIAVLEEERYPVLSEKLKVNEFEWLEYTGICFK